MFSKDYQEITIEDQTLRDGIQREKRILTTEEKISFVKEMIACGINRFQVTAFVNPKKVPQMADAERLIKELSNIKGASFGALILNMKGLERAIVVGCQNVEISISASNSHSIKNTGMSFKEALEEFQKMVKRATQEGLRVKTSIQCSFGCKIEGKINSEIVKEIVRRGISLGATEVSLADTSGMATPDEIKEKVEEVLRVCDGLSLFLHLHNTPDGKIIENVATALEMGIKHFDATLANTGGCPFIEGALPNLAIEELVLVLHKRGIKTPIDLERITLLGKKLIGLLKDEN